MIAQNTFNFVRLNETDVAAITTDSIIDQPPIAPGVYLRKLKSVCIRAISAQRTSSA